MMRFEVSDWVQGKTVDGEFIHGYIEMVDAHKGIARVRVVQSDNEEAVGRVIGVRESWLRSLPVNPLADKNNVESLIDMALATYDEAWFNELTDRLNGSESKNGKKGDGIRLNGRPNNRLGLFEKK
ncbi:hypothetical protein FHS19_005838 [Paenibacillus rhizosphaerae]|uniref:IDEAL domain-containing protein n=1 Tax=Paenibacillus rhizosphaerae TaxID=297318 RepID=A0A839U0F0_9BACL|nr:hypothetical protein [Paenibacillus rhizosphaerae]MBB3131118.1 hypothetical protein [Paenibacillus rhizosphaerae]